MKDTVEGLLLLAIRDVFDALDLIHRNGMSSEVTEIMREKKRINRICRKIQKLWEHYPNMRLGQLLENFVFTEGQRGDSTSVRLFYQEDIDTEKILDEILKEEI